MIICLCKSYPSIVLLLLDLIMITIVYSICLFTIENKNVRKRELESSCDILILLFPNNKKYEICDKHIEYKAYKISAGNTLSFA